MYSNDLQLFDWYSWSGFMIYSLAVKMYIPLYKKHVYSRKKLWTEKTHQQFAAKAEDPNFVLADASATGTSGGRQAVGLASWFATWQPRWQPATPGGQANTDGSFITVFHFPSFPMGRLLLIFMGITLAFKVFRGSAAPAAPENNRSATRKHSPVQMCFCKGQGTLPCAARSGCSHTVWSRAQIR